MLKQLALQDSAASMAKRSKFLGQARAKLSFVKRLRRRLWGLFLARKHLSDRDCTAFVVEPKVIGVGDIVRSLPSISLYKRYAIETGQRHAKVVVLTLGRRRGLYEMNRDIDQIIAIDKSDHDNLRAFLLRREGKLKVFTMSTDTPRSCAAFGIPREYYDANTDQLGLLMHPGERVTKEAEHFTAANAIDPEKTCILITKSQSSSSLPPDVFSEFASWLAEQEIHVFTNTIDSSTCVPGTEPISLPAGEMLAFVKMGAMVVGVQCGLMDVFQWLGLCSRLLTLHILDTEKDEQFSATVSVTQKNPCYGTRRAGP